MRVASYTLEILLLVLQLAACQRPIDKPNAHNTDSIIGCGCSMESPPPPPPTPFTRINSEQLQLQYDGKATTFRASLSTNQLFELSGGQLQTYTIVASNTYRPDTENFYFALPPRWNRYWDKVTLRKAKTFYVIGYSDDSMFHPMYTLTLGNELNRGSMYMDQFVRIK